MRAAFENDKMGAAIKQYYPAEYESLVASFNAAVDRHENPERLHQLSYEAGQAAVGRHLVSASDEAAVHFAKGSIVVLKEMKRRSPGLCFATMTRTTPSRADTDGMLTGSMDAVQDTMEDAIVDVIRSSATTPQPAASRDAVMKTLTPVIQAMQRKYGNDLRILQGASPSSLGVSEETACDIGVDLYERLAELPPEQAGPAMRGLAAMR